MSSNINLNYAFTAAGATLGIACKVTSQIMLNAARSTAVVFGNLCPNDSLLESTFSSDACRTIARTYSNYLIVGGSGFSIIGGGLLGITCIFIWKNRAVEQIHPDEQKPLVTNIPFPQTGVPDDT